MTAMSQLLGDEELQLRSAAAEMLRNPTYPEHELDKIKQQLFAVLATIEKNPSRFASSLFNRAVSLLLPAVPKPIVGRFSRRYIAGLTVDEAFAGGDDHFVMRSESDDDVPNYHLATLGEEIEAAEAILEHAPFDVVVTDDGADRKSVV